MSSGNSILNVPTFPEASQLSGQTLGEHSKTELTCSHFPSPGEWIQRERMVASIIYLNCTDPKYNPETTTMEEHEKKMKNLLKTLHNLGGLCNDYQFRLIVIASMPKSWKDYVLNVPGIFSTDTFTYLHHLYLDKVGRHAESTDDYIKDKVAALVAQHLASLGTGTTAASVKRERPICINPVCPTKVGHTIDRCWAKGGGAEGKAPKSWRDKHGTKAAASSTSPIDVYVGSSYSPKGSESEMMPF
ncbi:hypothetical protein BT96DRAFT_936117 [Gymnopus androsaceus JB14]|uniref:Uncharacterized protein n=1 Tax=Gymnopus androsaceus JB14 TaxID=1447944 RepID=A0A6A4I424_9AGAR|nr:hypothetical protein BT96DRAFT_936117 [Gymnopus androsaceus JB14]